MNRQVPVERVLHDLRDVLDNGLEPDRVFHRWSMPDLVDADRTFRWLAKNLLVRPTYGQVGGPRKTLKTYVAMFVNIGVASGQPIFGQFPVPEAGPVVYYAGEGGRVPITNRLERVAQAMGVKLRDLPLYAHFETAPFGSEMFRATLRADLDELGPALVAVDPFYAFHGTATNASNLFEEGALLTGLSEPCIDAGASLMLTNHFNKNGTGAGIDRITQSGAQEWCDTWMLLSHRADPDVENGRFELLLEVGSRQWGGSSWDLDIDIGRFDADRGEHDGTITWDLRRHEPEATGGVAVGKTRDVILDILADMPWCFTKTEVRSRAGGDRGAFDQAWDALHDEVGIVAERLPHQEGDRSVRRDLWAPAGSIRPDVPTRTDETVPVAAHWDLG